MKATKHKRLFSLALKNSSLEPSNGPLEEEREAMAKGWQGEALPAMMHTNNGGSSLCASGGIIFTLFVKREFYFKINLIIRPDTRARAMVKCVLS